MGNYLSQGARVSGTKTVTSTLTTVAQSARPKMHIKCRGELYPRGDNIRRFQVPDDKVSWSIAFEGYKPTEYTNGTVSKQPVWADLDFKTNQSTTVLWNELDQDGKVDRRSHMGKYEVITGLPRNPVGRTGVCARGTLGRWGPNHAADPIVTRWRRNNDGERERDLASGKPILQFIAICRGDSGEWAIPGGMVDAGENVSCTLKREFSEEAMDMLSVSEEEREALEENIQELFEGGNEIYRGYVDDPRNTDNSWMETVAMNFHDECGDSVGRIKLNAGDDAVGVQWTDIDGTLSLFASHRDFIELTATKHNAHW